MYKLNNGQSVSGMADFGKGSPTYPMTYDEVADKFLDCAEFAHWDMTQAKEVIAIVAEFDKLGDIHHLMSLLRIE